MLMKYISHITPILAFAIILILTAGCSQQYVQPEEKNTTERMEETEKQEPATEEEPADQEREDEEAEELELEVTTEEIEEVVVTPVDEPAQYEEAEADPSDEEKDNCGCSFRWDPLCGRDGRTYINRCLYQCFGGDLDDIEMNSRCPKVQSPIDIYTDDIEYDYEKDKWNGGYCWRSMWRDTGTRYCRNLIVNGRVNKEPEPAAGNWLDEEHLVLDRQGRADSHTIKLETGQQATNEEYELTVQPLFEKGRYRLSFWARQDVAANNDWKVKLTLKDWWESKPKPVGVEGCYEVMTEIDAQKVYIEDLPKEWKHYHYEFDVPLELEQWTSYERRGSDCEYEWDMTPHGYGIEITAPTIGYAMFDDFVLEKIE